MVRVGGHGPYPYHPHGSLTSHHRPSPAESDGTSRDCLTRKRSTPKDRPLSLGSSTVYQPVNCNIQIQTIASLASCILHLAGHSILSAMPSSILVLTGKDVAKLLESPSTIRSALESQSRAFKAYSSSNRQGSIQAPLRTTLTSNDVTTLVMPARADAKQDLGGIGIKVVSVPNEGNAGLPATTTIFDEATGNLRAVINARALTALRNACGEPAQSEVRR
jgi:hypothetical protein